MSQIKASTNGFSVAGYPGDAKVMLAFNFEHKPGNLAGFTIQVTPPGRPRYFLWNDLQFKDSAIPVRASLVRTRRSA